MDGFIDVKAWGGESSSRIGCGDAVRKRRDCGKATGMDVACS